MLQRYVKISFRQRIETKNFRNERLAGKCNGRRGVQSIRAAYIHSRYSAVLSHDGRSQVVETYALTELRVQKKLRLLLDNLSLDNLSLDSLSLDSLCLSLAALAAALLLGLAALSLASALALAAASLLIYYLGLSSLALGSVSLLLLVTAASHHRNGCEYNGQHKNLLHNSKV